FRGWARVPRQPARSVIRRTNPRSLHRSEIHASAGRGPARARDRGMGARVSGQARSDRRSSALPAVTAPTWGEPLWLAILGRQACRTAGADAAAGKARSALTLGSRVD